MIPQPDRLLQACLHPSPSVCLFLSLSLLFVSVRHLSLGLLLPERSCCHPRFLPPHRPPIIAHHSHPSARPSAPSASSPFHRLRFLSLPVQQLSSRTVTFHLRLSHSYSALLRVLQIFPLSLSPSGPPFIFIPPDPIRSSTPCNDLRFGSVRSANRIQCSLHSSRMLGAPGLPVGRGTLTLDHSEARSLTLD